MKKSVLFRKYLYIGLTAWITLFLISCHNRKIVKLQSDIDRISTRWVPDKRVGICSVRLKYREKGTAIITGESTIPDAKKEIIKTLDNQFKSLIDSILILPDTIHNKKYSGIVSLSVANLRKEPDDASELVSQAKLGTPVLILKKSDSWLLVKTPDNYISWTEDYSIEPLTGSEMTKWKRTSRVIYLENTGWLHDTISENSGVVSDLVGGSIMEKSGEMNGFVRVLLPDGRRGFVEKSKVMDLNVWKKSVACTEESVCRIAKTFLGLPYLWGGTSAKAVDCSGFVQSVYFMNGYILARDASLQALYGTTVDISHGYGQLRNGDLLFLDH